MDGPADITQHPVAPGGSFTYEFTAGQASAYFYHSHDHPDRQQGLGLYGALISDRSTPPATPPYDLEYTVQSQEWLEREGLTVRGPTAVAIATTNVATIPWGRMQSLAHRCTATTQSASSSLGSHPVTAPTFLLRSHFVLGCRLEGGHSCGESASPTSGVADVVRL